MDATNKQPHYREVFKVPEGYFDGLSDQITQMVSEAEEASSRKTAGVGLARRIWTIASAAAVLAGLVVGGFSVVRIQQSFDRQISELTASESFEEYLLDEIDYFHVEEFIADAE